MFPGPPPLPPRRRAPTLAVAAAAVAAAAWLFAGSGPARAAGGSGTTTGSWTLYRYENREYVTVQNVADFYNLQNVSAEERRVVLRSAGILIEGQAGTKELSINGVKFILSYELLPLGGQVMLSRIDLTKLVEPVLRPNRMLNARPIRTIILDPGHGGHDHGAVSVFGDEKTYALDVCLRTRELLRRRGFRVELTRTADEFIPLEARAQFANRYRDGLFVCVHFNAGSTTGSGVETYTLAPRYVPSTDQDGPAVRDTQLCAGNIDDPENMALATAMHAAMLNRLPMIDRGIKRARFWVLRECTIPAVLVEGGFLSNPVEASRIAQPFYRQAMAEAIVLAIGNYQRATANQHPPPILARAEGGGRPGPAAGAATAATGGAGGAGEVMADHGRSLVEESLRGETAKTANPDTSATAATTSGPLPGGPAAGGVDVNGSGHPEPTVLREGRPGVPAPAQITNTSGESGPTVVVPRTN